MAYTREQLESLARQGSFVNDPNTGQQISAQQYAQLQGLGQLPQVDQSLANGRPIQSSPFDYSNQGWSYQPPPPPSMSGGPINQPSFPSSGGGKSSDLPRYSSGNNSPMIDPAMSQYSSSPYMQSGAGWSPGGVTDNGLNGPPSITPALTNRPDSINPNFSSQFEGRYLDLMNNLGGQIQQQYAYRTPTAEAAQMNLGSIPQPGAERMTAAQMTPASMQASLMNPASMTASQFGISPELQFLMSGQGLPPEVLAQMRAQAIDDNSNATRSAMSSAKLASGDMGTYGSPAAAAMQADLGRIGAQNEGRALSDIAIQNALLGNQNRQFGVGQQGQIGMFNTGQQNQAGLANMNSQNLAGQFNAGAQNNASQFNANSQNQAGLANMNSTNMANMSNMEQANQMAIANANRLFAGLQQNVGNQQQTNMFNTGNEANQMLQGANAVAGHVSSQGNALQNGAINRQNQADFTNNQNQINWQENNADRINNMNQFDVNNREGRTRTAMGIMGGAGFSPMNY